MKVMWCGEIKDLLSKISAIVFYLNKHYVNLNTDNQCSGQITCITYSHLWHYLLCDTANFLFNINICQKI